MSRGMMLGGLLVGIGFTVGALFGWSHRERAYQHDVVHEAEIFLAAEAED